MPGSRAPGLTLGEILRRSARPDTFGRKVALIQGDARITYAELDERANRIAHALLDLGVRKGDRVAVLGRNSADYVAIIFGLAKAGGIIVPLNVWYKGDELVYAVTQSGCRFFLLDASFSELVTSVKGKLDRIERYVEFGRGADAPDLASLMAKASPAEPDVTIDETDARVIMYTSGTTGFPKGATLSHRQHYLHALVYVTETGVTEDDRGLLIYPLFHTGGTDCLLVPFFLVGATVVVLERPDVDDILAAIERERATFVFCVPTVWRRLVRAMAGRSVDVSSVRACLSASDTIRREDLEAIKAKFNAPITQLYGLTEAGVITHFLKPRDHANKLGSVGRAHPLVDVRIVDSEGRDVAPGEVGEILMKGPTIMLGYWDMPEKTAETIRDGWLHSGDLGRVDDDGFLYIMGRAKDMIISGGENIYSAETENAVAQHPAVAACAVIGIPSDEWGESVHAVVVCKPGETVSADALIAHCKSLIAGYKCPRSVEFRDALPLSGAGKVLKTKLREPFWQGRERTVA
jgi:acyl-CoA synthetase (AMP-forming)/AMP-acid ligase II